MIKQRVLGRRRFLLLVPILVALLFLTGQGLPGPLHAQGPPPPQSDGRHLPAADDFFACWASGPLVGPDDIHPGWGDDDEFVIDHRDLGDDARFNSPLNTKYLDPPHTPNDADTGHFPDAPLAQQVYTLFRSLPEMVDYAFALDVLGAGLDTKIPDRRAKMMAYKLRGGDFPLNPKEDFRMFLPWDYVTDPVDRKATDLGSTGEGREAREAFLKRRGVAFAYSLNHPIRSLSAEWIDPANPGGGSETDAVAMLQDNAANMVELTEATSTTAGDGGRVHYGTTEGVGQEIFYQTGIECHGDGNCSDISNYSSVPVPVTLHISTREQNDGEVDRNAAGEGSRALMVVETTGDGVVYDSKVDARLVSPSTLRDRDGGQGGYDRAYQENTERDELRISLKLHSKYRRDFDYTPDLTELMYSKRSLPAMGFDPWTYSNYNGSRDPSLNDTSGLRDDHAFGSESSVHRGYRQPRLERPSDFLVDMSNPNRNAPPSLRRDPDDGDYNDPQHIRWPVNLEDLNWYLYELPTNGYREPLWFYWLTPQATSLLVFGAYGKNATPFPHSGDVGFVGPLEKAEQDNGKIPFCELQSGADLNYPGVEYRKPLNASDIHCYSPTQGINYRKLYPGTHEGVHFPFDVSDSIPPPPPPPTPVPPSGLLAPSMLVKQGVESPVDAGRDLGGRSLSRFDFSILESEPMGGGSRDEQGSFEERRFGFPRESAARESYIGNWKSDPVDPNMPYLLVFTYYEADHDGELDFTLPWEAKDTKGIKLFSLPKRQLRRVICRAMVYPAGWNTSSGEYKSFVREAVDWAISFVNDWIEQLGGWIAKGLGSVAEFSVRAGVRTSEVACVGMGKLDELTSIDNFGGPAPPALVDEDGRIRINAASRSKLEGSERCHRISTPPVSDCEGDADIIVQGRCTRLPEYKLSVHHAEFIRPPAGGVSYREYRAEVPSDAFYESQGEQGFIDIVNATADEGLAWFRQLPDISVDSPARLDNYNRGLTRAYVKWEVRWDTVSPDVHDRVNGFVVVVHPDQKSLSEPVPKTGIPFLLPKWVSTGDRDADGTYYTRRRVEGFAVGGLDHYPTDSIPNLRAAGVTDEEKARGLMGSDSLVHLKSGDAAISHNAVGPMVLQEHYRAFNDLIHNLPLAPGFKHSFQVAPYVGHPGDPDFSIGPLSEHLPISGDNVACDEVRGDLEDGADGPDDLEDIPRLYGCPGSSGPVLLGYTDEEFRPGLLALTGTDICDDIFSSTPAGFTWDNPVVKDMRLLMMVLAGAVLFTLFVWQSLRMTYDVLLDPQPATGFRELVPRFLLAIVLVWGSLLLCRVVLVLASDLTCFVAQMTGMSMWGAIGMTFGFLMDGYIAWVQTLDSAIASPLLFLLSNAILIFAFGLLVLLVMLYLLYLFAKVFLGMLLRIALLAVLIALSPLAMALFASDSTAHWTKRWVSMFLGATFQQVLVLIVIYMGIAMIGEYLSRGAETGLVELVVGMILTFITLSMAAAIPDIVNPGGKGIFGSFTSMGGMALAATTLVASGGLGAVSGGVRGAFSGGGSSGGGGGPSGPGGGDSDGGPSVPGGPSGGGRPSPGLISSVARRSLGGPGLPGLSDQGPADGGRDSGRFNLSGLSVAPPPSSEADSSSGIRESGSPGVASPGSGGPVSDAGTGTGGGAPVALGGVRPPPGGDVAPGAADGGARPTGSRPDAGTGQPGGERGALGGVQPPPGTGRPATGGAQPGAGGERSTEGDGAVLLGGGVQPPPIDGRADSAEAQSGPASDADDAGSPGGPTQTGSPGGPTQTGSPGGPTQPGSPGAAGGGQPRFGVVPSILGGVRRPPSIVDPSTGDGGPSTGGDAVSRPGRSSRGEESPQGLLGRVVGGMRQGWVSGVRRGTGLNVRASDLASGRSFYRHSSRGDDSARQLSQLRREQVAERSEMKGYYERIVRALEGGGEGDKDS